MNTSTILGLLISCIVLVILLLIGIMIVTEKPAIEVQDVKITSLTRSEMNFEIRIAITNPYPLGVSVSEFSYTITAQRPGDPLLLATGTTEEMGEIKVAGSSTTDITIPVQINNSGIISAGMQLLIEGNMKMLVSGSAQVDLKVLHPTIPFSKEFTITREDVISGVSGGNEIISYLLTAGTGILSRMSPK